MRCSCLLPGVLLFLLLAGFAGVAQSKKELALEQACRQLDSALVAKDTMSLEYLLDDAVQYGHSNAWTETKDAVKANLGNGILTYKSIQPIGMVSKRIEGNMGIVWQDIAVDIIYEHNAIQMKLRVLQVWYYKHKKWQLWSRQSVKL